MIDVLAMLCWLEGGGCAWRTVPVGAATCAEAQVAAAARLEAWTRVARVEGSRCGTLDVSPLVFEEVSPGLFVHRGAVALADATNGGDIGNAVIIVGEKVVAVIDPGGSRALGDAVAAAVRVLTDKPIRYAILTHGHPDHVFGATALADAGAEVWAPAGLTEGLALRAGSYLEQGKRQVGVGFLGSEVPEVDRRLQGAEVLDLGNRMIELRAWPPAHSAADLTVLDRATGTLIAGDLVVDKHLPTLDGSLSGWLDVLDDLEKIGATRVVPGHGGPVLPWPDAARPVQRYLETLARDLRALLADGATMGEAAAIAAEGERRAWTLFGEHNPRNATVGYAELEWD